MKVKTISGTGIIFGLIILSILAYFKAKDFFAMPAWIKVNDGIMKAKNANNRITPYILTN